MASFHAERPYYFGRQPRPPPSTSGRVNVDMILTELEPKNEAELEENEFNRKSRPSAKHLAKLGDHEKQQLVIDLKKKIGSLIIRVLKKRASFIQDQFLSDLEASYAEFDEEDIAEEILESLKQNGKFDSYLQNYAERLVKAFIVQDKEWGSNNEGPTGKVRSFLVSARITTFVRLRVITDEIKFVIKEGKGFR